MNEPIIFFGTGPVAAESLRLLSQWANVEAVVTKPQPAHHKGSFPVLEVAAELQLPVITVSDKRSLDDIFDGRTFASRVGVLIDFGIIVSQTVIDAFPLGIINSHFSLLPEWRGADPITFSILSGQSRTGVSLMLLVEKMDEGPILATEFYDLSGRETTPQLTEGLIELSDAALQTVVPRYLGGQLSAIDQAAIAAQIPDYPAAPTYSRKLTKADGVLDFSKPAEQLEREIRAFSGWPGSRTTLAGKDVIITAAHVAGYDIQGADIQLGAAFRTPDNLIGLPCGEGVLVIDRLKPAGKAEMPVRAFLAGAGRDL